MQLCVHRRPIAAIAGIVDGAPVSSGRSARRRSCPAGTRRHRSAASGRATARSSRPTPRGLGKLVAIERGNGFDCLVARRPWRFRAWKLVARNRVAASALSSPEARAWYGPRDGEVPLDLVGLEGSPGIQPGGDEAIGQTAAVDEADNGGDQQRGDGDAEYRQRQPTRHGDVAESRPLRLSTVGRSLRAGRDASGEASTSAVSDC